MIKKIAERSLLIVETLVVGTQMRELSTEMIVLATLMVATVVLTTTIVEHARKAFAVESSQSLPRTTIPEKPSRSLLNRSRFF